MEQYTEVIISALVALIVAGISYLKSYLDNKRLKERLDNIVDVLHNDEHNYFIKCPKCGSKILLAEVTIYSEKEGGASEKN